MSAESRLCEYVAVVSAPDDDVCIDPLADASAAENEFSVPFVPEVVGRYPAEDRPNSPFPPLCQFCFPRGLWFRRQMDVPQFYGFVLTGLTGDRMFGACLILYEEATPAMGRSALAAIRSASRRAGGLPEQRDSSVIVPKCVCVVSRYPLFNAFKQWLSYIYRESIVPTPVPVERYIVNFAEEVPLPPMGRLVVQVMVGDALVTLTRPAPNELPYANVDMERLFQCLDLDNIIKLLSALLTEHKIVVISKHLSLLCTCCEAALSLIFPFTWQHVYIPVLPWQLIDFVQAPTPFLIGLHADDLSEAVILPDVVAVDLDRNSIQHTESLLRMPIRETTKLRQAIVNNGLVYRTNHPDLVNVDCAFSMALTPSEVSSNQDDHRQFRTREIREGFLRFFVAMFKSYHKYLVKGHRDMLFNKSEFLLELPVDKRPFMKQMLDSQAFERFAEEALAPRRTFRMRFFDEAIIAKLNRSKRQIRKQKTPFLKDTAYAVRKSVLSDTPYTADLPSGRKYYYDKFRLDTDLFYTPRNIAKLVESDDEAAAHLPIKASWKTTLATLAALAEMPPEAAHSTESGSLLRMPQFEQFTIRTTETCPDCNVEIDEAAIRRGWSNNSHDYTTGCPKCSRRFVPRFCVTDHEVAQSTPQQQRKTVRNPVTYCEFLSAITLKKEVENLLNKDVALDARLFQEHPTIFWNLILHFNAHPLPVNFLLPQVDWWRSVSKQKRPPASASAAAAARDAPGSPRGPGAPSNHRLRTFSSSSQSPPASPRLRSFTTPSRESSVEYDSVPIERASVLTDDSGYSVSQAPSSSPPA